MANDSDSDSDDDLFQSFEISAFLPAQLAALSRLTQALLASALDQCGMTIPQWRVSLCLVKKGASTLNDIVAFTNLPQSSLSRTIARMDELGMVQSRRNQSDRRHAVIEITAAGKQQLARAIGIVNEKCYSALALNDEEMDRFRQTVSYLIPHLKNSVESH